MMVHNNNWLNYIVDWLQLHTLDNLSELLPDADTDGRSTDNRRDHIG